MAIMMKKQADSQGEKDEVFEADVVGLDHEGRGIVRRSGKAVFVHNALPGERIACRVVQTDKRFDVADAVEILRPRDIGRMHHARIRGVWRLLHAAY